MLKAMIALGICWFCTCASINMLKQASSVGLMFPFQFRFTQLWVVQKRFVNVKKFVGVQLWYHIPNLSTYPYIFSLELIAILNIFPFFVDQRKWNCHNSRSWSQSYLAFPLSYRLEKTAGCKLMQITESIQKTCMPSSTKRTEWLVSRSQTERLRNFRGQPLSSGVRNGGCLRSQGPTFW